MPQPSHVCQFIFICTAAAQPGKVTFTWTRPMQTQEIVLPPASPYIIYVIQCLRTTERSPSSSSIQPAECSPHPHTKTWLQTHTHISLPLKWPQVCTWQVCTDICKNLSALTCLLSGLFQTHTHTGACTLHPCSVQPPTLLKAATLGACACESGCRLSSPHRCTPSAQGSEGNEGFRSSL